MSRTTCHVSKLLLAAAALIAPSALGCNSKPTRPYGTVTGRVTVASEPVGAGCVVFHNAELGVARMAELDADGRFVASSHDLPGLPVGNYQVSITSQQISRGDFVVMQRPSGKSSGVVVPARYHDPATSQLTAEVREGRNPPLHFALER